MMATCQIISFILIFNVLNSVSVLSQLLDGHSPIHENYSGNITGHFVGYPTPPKVLNNNSSTDKVHYTTENNSTGPPLSIDERQNSASSIENTLIIYPMKDKYKPIAQRKNLAEEKNLESSLTEDSSTRNTSSTGAPYTIYRRVPLDPLKARMIWRTLFFDDVYEKYLTYGVIAKLNHMEETPSENPKAFDANWTLSQLKVRRIILEVLEMKQSVLGYVDTSNTIQIETNMEQRFVAILTYKSDYKKQNSSNLQIKVDIRCPIMFAISIRYYQRCCFKELIDFGTSQYIWEELLVLEMKNKFYREYYVRLEDRKTADKPPSGEEPPSPLPIYETKRFKKEFDKAVDKGLQFGLRTFLAQSIQKNDFLCQLIPFDIPHRKDADFIKPSE